ncbi:hypothetical protein B0T24DRAFT_378920 [Lasiosphaeria ovina]|uniref:Uncharacterized protein n=1 Tax=Lasiosphaeria ovina TaxID=92902 RepID=A0AAE0JZR5_9PEZI|nr:hypothetical protein B0T24DRAFT_378920 [Lasiosphaeria ovina]
MRPLGIVALVAMWLQCRMALSLAARHSDPRGRGFAKERYSVQAGSRKLFAGVECHSAFEHQQVVNMASQAETSHDDPPTTANELVCKPSGTFGQVVCLATYCPCRLQKLSLPLGRDIAKGGQLVSPPCLSALPLHISTSTVLSPANRWGGTKPSLVQTSSPSPLEPYPG